MVMQQPSERYEIWQRLRTRFLLWGRSSGRAALHDTIQPVTSVDDLLKRERILREELDLSVTAGTVVNAFQVGRGKRWTVLVLQRQGTSANTLVRVRLGPGAVSIPITSQGTSEQVVLNVGISLPENAIIEMLATGDAGDSSRTISVFVLEEDSF